MVGLWFSILKVTLMYSGCYVYTNVSEPRLQTFGFYPHFWALYDRSRDGRDLQLYYGSVHSALIFYIDSYTLHFLSIFNIRMYVRTSKNSLAFSIPRIVGNTVGLKSFQSFWKILPIQKRSKKWFKCLLNNLKILVFWKWHWSYWA